MSEKKQEGCPSSGGCSGGNAAMAMQDKLIESSLTRIKNKLVVMSGKGGVGKSSIAANIAAGLAKRGHKTGLLDVDLHGPSIACIMGIKDMLDVTPDNFIVPWKYGDNLKVVSMQALMPEKDTAVIWRGPAKHGVIRQFIADVEWGDLDFLVIDSPPGTGDEPLTVAQVVTGARAVIVATPQEVALADVRKSISFCATVGLKVEGLIENMGSFACPHCEKKIDLFPAGGGQFTAKKMGIPYLGSLPFDPNVVRACDQGLPVANFKAESPFVAALDEIIDKIEKNAVA
ncbi:MAG: Mrp/NBP35 family ATP-binding protein [Desulfatibacillaceae bacterium]|nr:Mrp/NBP35 family ATP-binding protein [Desulfatibacillaceae bacterium]